MNGQKIRTIQSEKKQPYFIRSKNQKPVFLAALAQVHAELAPHEGDGFVIVTAASDQGMMDIHDRRPSVLSSELAREWANLATEPARETEIAQEGCTSVDEFEWYAVGKAVGNVRNQGAGLIEEIE